MAASTSSGKTEQMEGREHGKRDFSSAQGSFRAEMRIGCETLHRLRSIKNLYNDLWKSSPDGVTFEQAKGSVMG